MHRIILIALVPMVMFVGCAGTSATGTGGGGIPTMPWQSGSSLKLGYIRSDVISEKYADYRDADNSLEKDNRKWLAEADKMEEVVRSKERKLEEVRLILSEERLSELEKELIKERKALQKYRNDTWYAENSTYVKRRRELMAPIDARVNDAIWKVAEEEGLDLVFDTIAGNIVFAKEGLDITDLVMEELGK